MSSPNWGNLVASGRARAYGVPCTEEELNARKLGIPKEYYLNGILTLEAYETAVAEEQKKGKPIERMDRNEIAALAKDQGIDFTPDAPASALKDVVKKGKKSK